MQKHIALLQGGMSSEREVSLSSGKGIAAALKELGYKVTPVDPDRNLAENLKKIKPDVAFIALHGTYGEDGCVQGLLEIMGIPYTHSGLLASAVAMNKVLTKSILAKEGILSAEGRKISREEVLAGDPMKRPFVIKPVDEGSSVGIFIIKKGDNTIIKAKDIEKIDNFMVEKYIPGRELSVAVMGDKALGVIELRPKSGFYDYKNKYTDGKTEHLMPAPLDKKVYKKAMDAALKAHKTLGCSGISRSDFRYDEEGDGNIYFLEINTHPGMTPLSLVPEIAAHSGVSYKDIVDYLVKEAKCHL